MTKYYTFILFFLFSGTLVAKNDRQKVDSTHFTLMDCNGFLVNGEFSKGKNCLKQFLSSKSYQSPKEKAMALNNLGVANYELGQYAEGVRAYQKALHVYEETRNDTLLAQAQLNLGLAYKEIGLDSLAITSLNESISTFDALHLSREKSSGINAIGNLYRDAGQYFESEKMLKRSYRIRLGSEDEKGVAKSLHNLGTLYLVQDDFEKAKGFYQEALKLKKRLGNPLLMASTYAKLGELFIRMEELDSARYYLNKSVSLRIRSGKKKTKGTALSNMHLGRLHMYANQFDSARVYFDQSMEFLEQNNAQKDLLDLYSEQVVLYKKTGRLDAALTYMEKLQEMRYTVASDKHKMELAKLSIEYDIDAYEVRIFNQSEKNRLLMNRNSWLLIGLVSLISLCLTVIYFLRQSKRTRSKILIQNNILIQRQEEIELLRNELVHRTKNYFSMMEGMASFEKKKVQSDELKELLTRYENRFRSISELQHSLSAKPDSFGHDIELDAYLNGIVENLRIIACAKGKCPEVNYDLKKVVCHYDVCLRLGIIANELVTNSIKYNASEKPNLSIGLVIEEGDIVLKVQDNGTGIEIDQSQVGTGLGLINLFLEKLNGKIEISNELGLCTKISVPIKKGDY